MNVSFVESLRTFMLPLTQGFLPWPSRVFSGSFPSLSALYIRTLSANCLRLFWQPACLALLRAAEREGINKAAKMAMIEITISTSIKVKPTQGRAGRQQSWGAPRSRSRGGGAWPDDRFDVEASAA